MIADQELSSSGIAKKLLSIIRAEKLTQGDRLPSIRQLSARFAVRPHIVRDALLQVQTMGHVIVRPRSRAVVQSLPANVNGIAFEGLVESTLETSDHHLFHLLEARQTLELELVSRAATQRRLEDLLPCHTMLDAMHAVVQTERPAEHLEFDFRFHLAIAQLAGNPVLASMLKSLLTALRPFLLSKAADAYYAEQAESSHMEIYRALVAGDPDLARQHMQKHLQLAYDRLLLDVQSIPGRRSANVNRRSQNGGP